MKKIFHVGDINLKKKMKHNEMKIYKAFTNVRGCHCGLNHFTNKIYILSTFGPSQDLWADLWI